MKLKAGDEIRMISDCYNGTDMKSGTVAVIASVSENGNFTTYDPDGSPGCWHFNVSGLDTDFELVNEKINVTSGVLDISSRIDTHYDFFYELTMEETNLRQLKIDPYFVAKQWRLGERDPSGVLFHILKTIARFGDKNSKEREIKAIYLQIKRLAELEGVELE